MLQIPPDDLQDALDVALKTLQFYLEAAKSAELSVAVNLATQIHLTSYCMVMPASFIAIQKGISLDEALRQVMEEIVAIVIGGVDEPGTNYEYLYNIVKMELEERGFI